MNEMKKQHINQLVTKYNEVRDEARLEEIYRMLQSEYQSKLNYWSKTTSFLSGYHDIQANFDDAFMTTIEAIGKSGGDFVKLFHRSLDNRFKSLLRKLQTRRKHEQYEVDSDDEDAATFEIASDFNLEEEVTERMAAKQKDDQRQLIDFLVCGENDRTTAIVQAYLSTGLKTPTAIGNHLGLNHKQVSRALHRLAAKYDTKQFGEYTDYLVAL